jgi:hypothetical protein
VFLKQRNVAMALWVASHYGIPKQRAFYSTGTGIITIITSALGFEINTSFNQQFQVSNDSLPLDAQLCSLTHCTKDELTRYCRNHITVDYFGMEVKTTTLKSKDKEAWN